MVAFHGIRDMRNAGVISLIVYLASWWVLDRWFGNHGLWASFMVFYIIRALTLYHRYKPLMIDRVPGFH
ncbi:MAG: hypothetical protein GY940_24585 [bacterium]|nr:hypothetical protein [bacterium]